MYSGAQKASWILNFVLLCLVLTLCIFLWLKPAGEAPRPVYDEIKKIEIVRHDTLMKLDTILKYKIRTIESEPDSVVIKSVDTLFDSAERVDTLYLERAFLKCSDSLSTWKQKVQIDSEAIMKIDTVISANARDVDKEKACSLVEQAKSFGSGFLVGVGIRSLF